MSALDIVIVSHGDGDWLPACLASLAERAGGCEYRVVVVENKPGAIIPAVADRPEVRVLHVANRGFGAGNNEGISIGDAAHVLILNPDTELQAGTLADAVGALEQMPDVGLLAARQVTGDGELWPTMRHFPSPRRALLQALAVEQWAPRGRSWGERILDPSAYERVADCDWTTGAVMFVRREAIEAAGGFDERFFLFSEETDLAKRLKQESWRVVHTPAVTFVHHAGKAGVDPRREAQLAYARMQYARKHFSPPRRVAYWLALCFGYALRAATLARRPATRTSSAASAVAALRVLWGVSPPPYRAAVE